LLIAAAGKIYGERSQSNVSIAAIEAAIATALLVYVFPIEIALITTALCAGYLVHSIRTSMPSCRCFGERLPPTSRAGQILRNCALLAFAIILVLITLRMPQSVSTPFFSGLDVGFALLAAISLVVLPWLLDWTFANEQASDGLFRS
jgi:hypothetical protein